MSNVEEKLEHILECSRRSDYPITIMECNVDDCGNIDVRMGFSYGVDDGKVNEGYGCEYIDECERCGEPFCDSHLKYGLGASVCLDCGN